MTQEYGTTSDPVAVVAPTATKKPRRASKASAPRQRRAPSPTSGNGVLDDGLRSHKRMAYRFALMFKGTFIHTPGRGWLEFNASYWEECGESRPWNAVQSVCRAALAELSSIERPDWRDALYEDVRLCDTAGGTAGVLKHAQHWPGIGRRDDELNNRPDIFVTANGTYDLLADTFRPSDPYDLMTLAGGVDYDPDAQCPTYDALMELYQPDPAVRAYLHRLGGAAMQGRQNLQALVVNYGSTGGNGKGTTQRAWQHIFGSFSHVLPVEAMMARKGYDQYKDEKAQLQGKRLVYMTEPSAGQKFDTGTVKSLTGGDPVTSRAVYKASVTFEPTWLIMLSTNNRVSTPNDGGMARRLKEVGWSFTVPAGERDESGKLDATLRAEGAGILNRLLAGWRDFRDNGIQEPEAVTKATTDYLASVDPVARFIDERVDQADNMTVGSASLYAAYDKWCRDNGEHPMSNRLFSPDMEKRGFAKKATNRGNVWQGIGLVTTEGDGW